MSGFRRYRAARVIQRAVRRARVRRAAGRYARKGRMIRRQVGLGNPTPTFVETYKDRDVVTVPAGGGVGKVFKVRISDLPQVAQYFNLYKQYRINWVKVMMLPKINTENADPNTAQLSYNSHGGWMGMARIVYAIQDSPDVQTPANEVEVLQDNGCKIKAFKSKWSCSFKPVPDVAQLNQAGSPIWARQKYRQFFNFDQVTSGNNPEHGAVAAYISLPGLSAGATGPTESQTYYVYYKISFTLRDPQ